MICVNVEVSLRNTVYDRAFNGGFHSDIWKKWRISIRLECHS